MSTYETPPLIPPEWMRRAACLDRFDLDWIDPAPEHTRLCRLLCVGCPVRRECLATALISGEPWGIWGGLDPDERAELASASGLPMPAVVPGHGVHARYLRHGCRCRACRHAHAVYVRERRRKTHAA